MLSATKKQEIKRDFIQTEESISQNLGIHIPYPIRVFNLEQLGVNPSHLIDLLSANVPNLSWDYYDLRKAQLTFLKENLQNESENILKIESDYYLYSKYEDQIKSYRKSLTKSQQESFDKISAHRRRSICQFILTRTEHEWIIERIYESGFTQDVEDYREDERVFEQTSTESTDHIAFQNLLKGLANLTLEFKPKAQKLKLVAHEMATITKANTPGDNSPEGIHQDGSDFIVSALVLERKGVLGGQSLIFGPDKKSKYLEYTLKPSEGLFQADKGTQLWHKVTSIHLDPESELEVGERNILGFDIDVIA